MSRLAALVLLLAGCLTIPPPSGGAVDGPDGGNIVSPDAGAQPWPGLYAITWERVGGSCTDTFFSEDRATLAADGATFASTGCVSDSDVFARGVYAAPDALHLDGTLLVSCNGSERESFNPYVLTVGSDGAFASEVIYTARQALPSLTTLCAGHYVLRGTHL